MKTICLSNTLWLRLLAQSVVDETNCAVAATAGYSCCPYSSPLIIRSYFNQRQISFICGFFLWSKEMKKNITLT